jgi:hypothetical protein
MRPSVVLGRLVIGTRARKSTVATAERPQRQRLGRALSALAFVSLNPTVGRRGQTRSLRSPATLQKGTSHRPWTQTRPLRAAAIWAPTCSLRRAGQVALPGEFIRQKDAARSHLIFACCTFHHRWACCELPWLDPVRPADSPDANAQPRRQDSPCLLSGCSAMRQQSGSIRTVVSPLPNTRPSGKSSPASRWPRTVPPPPMSQKHPESAALQTQSVLESHSRTDAAPRQISLNRHHTAQKVSKHVAPCLGAI